MGLVRCCHLRNRVNRSAFIGSARMLAGLRAVMADRIFSFVG